MKRASALARRAPGLRSGARAAAGQRGRSMMSWSAKDTERPPEMWGGVECTVNRVGDRYCDQVERTGHGRRIDDLDRIAALALRTLRYPVLWERAAPNGLERADWRCPDQRLARLRELGIDP